MSYQSEVLADNPVLYLRFSETSGANCADSSTSGLVGTANGTFTRNVATGLLGPGIGITLGGTISDFVSVPANAVLDIVGSVTYECWIKPASLPAAGEIIARGWSAGPRTGYNMYLDNTGTIFLTDSNAGGVYAQTNGGAITAGSLFHVAMCCVPNGGAYTAYVNGVSNRTGTSQLNFPNGAVTVPLSIGVSNGNGTNQLAYPGLVDEVAIYNTVLSSARVAAHYAARNDPAGGGGGATKSPPGGIVAAIAQARNAERKASQEHGRPPEPGRPPDTGRRTRLDYLHKRGRPS